MLPDWVVSLLLGSLSHLEWRMDDWISWLIRLLVSWLDGWMEVWVVGRLAKWLLEEWSADCF